MIKTLWFMVKIGALVALALWVAERPGFVTVEWLGYDIRAHVGLFLVALLAVILLSIFIYNIIKTFVDFPKSYRRYNEVKRFEKGYRALTIGLSAVAAGDAKIANEQARRASALLKDDGGLALLLKAQAAKMDGRETEAQAAFETLTQSKDAAFLGVRGLLQAALEKGDDEGALAAARKALEVQPRQPWVIKTVYDMELRLRDWPAARASLRRAEKRGAITKAQAQSDRIAMWHVEGEALVAEGRRDAALGVFERAYKLDKSFVPSVVALARMCHQTGNRRRAVRLVERAWKAEPHPDLAQMWDALISRDRSKKSLGRMQWFERLLKLRADTSAAQMAAGQVAAEEGLWGEARGYFERAAALEPNALLYSMRAAMEEKSGASDEIVQKWLDKADDAQAAKAWTCTGSGRIYNEWQPISVAGFGAQGGFNTIKWAQPQGVFGAGAMAQSIIAEAVLEAPKKVG